jgi:hypothetical protein
MIKSRRISRVGHVALIGEKIMHPEIWQGNLKASNHSKI